MFDLTLTARHALGIFLLGVVVMLWVASSFLMRSIFGADKSYDKPFLVTWINTGTFSFYLIPWGIRTLCERAGLSFPYSRMPNSDLSNTKTGDTTRSELPAAGEPSELMDLSIRSPLLEEGRAADERATLNRTTYPVRSDRRQASSVRNFGSRDAELTEEVLEPLTTSETAKLGCVFSLLWFAANYFGNISLSYTNVASFTVISSLSGFFTLALGSVLGVETFTLTKLIALLVSVVGVFLVATQDTASSDSRFFFTDVIIGDILALVGAVLYGCYTVFLKFRVQNEERVSMPLFFGFVGVFNLVFLWPAIIILNFTGLEPFELPSTKTIWLIVAANASITFVSDYLWVLAMLMTSPLVVTVGISMSIPLALIGDHLLYSNPTSLTFLLGAALVFSSFIAINLGYDSDERHKKQTQRLTDDHEEIVDDDVEQDF